MVTKEAAVDFVTQLAANLDSSHHFVSSSVENLIEYFSNELVEVFKDDADLPLFQLFSGGWEEIEEFGEAYAFVIDEFAAQNFDAQAYALKNEKTNTLNQPQEDGWKTEFQQALAKLLVSRGTPVSLQPTVYGWMDCEYKDARRTKESIVYVSEVKEVYYDQFIGTFEGDKIEYALEATAIYASGFSRRLRLVGTLSSVLHELLK